MRWLHAWNHDDYENAVKKFREPELTWRSSHEAGTHRAGRKTGVTADAVHQGGEAQGPGKKEKVACVVKVWEHEGAARAERDDEEVGGVPG